MYFVVEEMVGQRGKSLAPSHTSGKRRVEIQIQTIGPVFKLPTPAPDEKRAWSSSFQTSPTSWFSVSRANSNFVSVYSQLKCFLKFFK